MSIKITWVVRAQALPALVRPCPDCRASVTRHRATGKFRVNANGKLLDVWLLVGCSRCGRTSKVPVHSRIHVRKLPDAQRMRFEGNDPELVRELMTSPGFARQASCRLDWTGTWRLESDTPFYRLGDPLPATSAPDPTSPSGSSPDDVEAEVFVRFELPAPIRMSSLLQLGLGSSEWPVLRAVEYTGQLVVPHRLVAKVRTDFQFFIVRPSPPNGRMRGCPGRGTP